jgi:hypothetical protein
LTDFERFASRSELCNCTGQTPVIRKSENKVNGRGYISKKRNQKLRNYSSCVPLILENTMRL